MDKKTLIAKYSPYTMTDDNRLSLLYDELLRVIENRIPGDFVEVGVWRGGNCLLAAEMFRYLKQSRIVWLFDTFDGMPPPTGPDGMRAFNKHKKIKDWCKVSLDEVRHNFEHFDLLDDNVRFVKGKIEETWGTFPWRRGICILREDTDFYESTKASLKHLYPEVSPGGTVIFDDYGKWEGQRKAVDEFMETHSHLELKTIDKDRSLRYLYKETL